MAGSRIRHQARASLATTLLFARALALALAFLVGSGVASGARRYPKERAEGLSPALKERIYRVGAAHPTLGDAALAEVLRAKPGLTQAVPWSAAEVRRLRTVGALPTLPERDGLLATLAARFLRALPDAAAFAQGLVTLAARHPGVTLERLTYLARYHPALARELLRQRQRAPRPVPTVPPLDFATAHALPLSTPVLLKILSRPGSPLVARLLERLRRIDATVGTGQGFLAPREHLARSGDALAQAVMAEVYARTGRPRTLRIVEEIAPHLPAAIVAAQAKRVRLGPAARTLRVEVAAEALAALGRDYEEKVLDGIQSPENFREAWAIAADDWAALKRALPGLFVPLEALPLDDRRLDAVSRAYGELSAGRLSTKAFYLRTGVSTELLALLQAADPGRFPRPQGAPAYQPTARGHDRRVAETLLDRLRGKRGPADERVAPRDPLYTVERARRLGERAFAIFERELFVDVTDIVRELNADAAFVAREGRLTTPRYQLLRALDAEAFPPLARGPENQRLVDERLGKDLAVLRAGGTLASPEELVTALQRKYPRLKAQRLERLRREHAGLFRPPPVRRTREERRADAGRVAELMRATGLSLKEASDALVQREARFHADYVYALRTEFKAEPFFAGMQGSTRVRQRAGLAVNEVARLLLELSPPGTSDAELLAAVNRYLVARGLPPYTEAVAAGALKELYGRTGGVRKHNARRVAALVAEYAATAERDTSEAEIMRRVTRDYPHLKPIELGRYRSLWAAHPEDYPELDPFFDVRPDGGASVRLHGLRAARPRRYRGGWDVERALFEPSRRDPVLARELAELSQFARIPVRLPLLDELVGELNGRTPLRKHNLLMVSHLLGTTPALMDALRAAGLSVERSIVVGTPYGSNRAVRRVLEHDGFDVRVPALVAGKYEETVAQALREMVERYRRDPRRKPILVMDDGGLVTKLLHETPEYADVLHAFHIVEQTTRGITLAEAKPLRVPVVAVARALCKAIEAPFIGRTVANKVLQALSRQGLDLEGKTVVVMGYGWVGRAVAHALRALDRRIRVVVVESNETKARSAGRRYLVQEKAEALALADVVIGATGSESLSLEDLGRLKDGVAIASASSKRIEFAMGQLEERATSRTLLANDNPLVTLPTARYVYGGKRILALGDGWPVNFDGDVEDVPAEQIQITRAAMFAGAIQAASLSTRFAKNQGIVALDEAMDRHLCQLFKQHRKAQLLPHRFDPALWLETVRDLFGYLRPADPR
ncbi:MAG: hypothetical protein IT371_19845 [Deltaproteobacteria bacterium]|nr:hypothetical protein [Deltaproteobacteria bacterium]